MAQLVVRRLDDTVKERLRARARKHGRSLEAEARAILEEAANGDRPRKQPAKAEKGFGTLIHERFKRTGFTDEEYAEFERHIARLRAEPIEARRLRQMIVLDTTVLSALMRRSEEPATIAWFDSQEASQLWMTAISVHEIRYGIELQAAGRRRRNLEQNFQEVLAAGLRHRVLPFDMDAAEASARIAARRYVAGTPAGLADTQIAGIAVSRNAALATHNIKHFADLPIQVIDPTSAPPSR